MAQQLYYKPPGLVPAFGPRVVRLLGAAFLVGVLLSLPYWERRGSSRVALWQRQRPRDSSEAFLAQQLVRPGHSQEGEGAAAARKALSADVGGWEEEDAPVSRTESPGSSSSADPAALAGPDPVTEEHSEEASDAPNETEARKGEQQQQKPLAPPPAAPAVPPPPVAAAAAGSSTPGSGARQLARPATPLPPSCRVTEGWHMTQDRSCYFDSVAVYDSEVAAGGPGGPYCFGFSDGSTTLRLHTVILNEVPLQLQLMVSSFLATQCCDAELWVWVTQAAVDSMAAKGTRPVVPPGHEHRIQWKLFSVDGLFASMRDDFPEINATAAESMKNFKDIRFQANWARLLVVYKHGGIYVDLDTMFLRDFRPLFAVPMFSYREGASIVLNIAVLRLGERPHELTRQLIAMSAIRHESTQRMLSTMMKPWANRSPWQGQLQYLSQSLFDVVWMRFLAWQEKGKGLQHQIEMQTPELAAIHPEFTTDKHWRHFLEVVTDPEEVTRREGIPFFAGSFSYHWHNRYEEGLPAGSWAGILAARFWRMASEKGPVCALGGGPGDSAAAPAAAAAANP